MEKLEIPLPPKYPLDIFIKEGSIGICSICHSSLKRKWFKIIGCIQPECENYYKKENYNYMSELEKKLEHWGIFKFINRNGINYQLKIEVNLNGYYYLRYNADGDSEYPYTIDNEIAEGSGSDLDSAIANLKNWFKIREKKEPEIKYSDEVEYFLKYFYEITDCESPRDMYDIAVTVLQKYKRKPADNH